MKLSKKPKPTEFFIKEVGTFSRKFYWGSQFGKMEMYMNRSIDDGTPGLTKQNTL